LVVFVSGINLLFMAHAPFIQTGERASLRHLWKAVPPRWLLGSFWLVWLCVNLWQAASTELIHDEAYYWTWSQDLSWIYAEHPPMVAWVIWLGQQLLPGELGVRLIPSMMGLGGLYGLWRLANIRSFALFAAVSGAVIGLQLGTWLAVPETPFFFFVVGFLWQYRRFLAAPSWPNTLLLGLLVAGLIYSKYHGLMLLGMVLLSHLALLRQGRFWGVVGVATLLLLPLLWEFVGQGFETIRFHLMQRNRGSWDWHYILNFFTGQWVLAGPLMSLLLFPSAMRRRPRDQFERALSFAMWGILIFLLLMSLRVWIEANWATSALVPMLILAMRELSQRSTWRGWAYRLLAPSLLLVLLLRSYLAVDWLSPLGIDPIKQEFHHWQRWAKEVRSVTGDTPVFFMNSYAYPSKLWFYGQRRTYAYAGATYHQTQYDAYPTTDSLRGREVYWMSTYRPEIYEPDSIQVANLPTFYYRKMRNFQAYDQLRLAVEDPLQGQAGDTLAIKVRITNPRPEPLLLDANPLLRPTMRLLIHQGGPWQLVGDFVRPLKTPVIHEKLTLEIDLPLTLAPGRYQAQFVLWAGSLPIGGGMRQSVLLEVLP
jgi:hypothetical protein